MGLSAQQSRALRRRVDSRQVKTRQVSGRELSYIEGWFAIAQANRIFGFDGWDRETLESKCVFSRDVRGALHVVYVSKVRVTVRTGDVKTFREAHGTGEAKAGSVGEIHELALKRSETDATKRALCTFGRAFGLALYGSGEPSKPGKIGAADAQARFGENPEPLVGASANLEQALTESGRSHETNFGGHLGAATSEISPVIVPDEVEEQRPEHDLSADILWPRTTQVRRRDKAHLRFVAQQNCLVCGRAPSDPHHLTFAQFKALGRKVSDEFTVPLCRIHHRALHHFGGEAKWWQRVGIDPLPIAEELWRSSHARLPRDLETIGSSS